MLEVKKQLSNWLLVEVWRMYIAIPTYIKFYLQAYVPLFSKLTGIKHPDHLMVQTNPVTLDSSDFVYSFPEKAKGDYLFGENRL